MRGFLTAGLLLFTMVPAGQTGVFTVKPGTAFYSKPQAKPELLVAVAGGSCSRPTDEGCRWLLPVQIDLHNCRP